MFRTLARAGALALVCLAVPAAAFAQAPAAPTSDPRDLNLRAYVELLRSDVRSQKVAIFTEMMDFTEAEDAAFWPIYRQYDVELSTLNDQRIRLITDYARNYASMTDDAADRIVKGVFDFDAKRSALLATYYDKVKTALSARQAARFLQIERQLLLIIDLQISASLPIVE